MGKINRPISRWYWSIPAGLPLHGRRRSPDVDPGRACAAPSFLHPWMAERRAIGGGGMTSNAGRGGVSGEADDGTPARASFADASVDFETGALTGPAGEVRLEPRLAGLLRALAAASPHMVSRSDLIDAVWGGAAGADQSLTNGVSQLRRALRDVGASNAVIETIPTRGYRLAAPVDWIQGAVRERARAGSRDGERARRPGLAPPRAAAAVLVAVAALLTAVPVAVVLVAQGGRGDRPGSAVAGRAAPDAVVEWVEPAACALHLPNASGRMTSSRADLPGDPAVAELYVAAREKWSSRRSEALEDAIRDLAAVTVAEPEFAAGHAALADAYLLSREFGQRSDTEAFSKALESAVRALALDPGLPNAHRAIGFVFFWWEHRPDCAGRHMRRALELDPGDGQTRFWYANMLADNGLHAAAAREFQKARLITPNSAAVRIDMAWAAWLAGDDDAALAELARLVEERGADLAVAYEALASVHLARGDYASHVETFAKYADVRGEPDLKARAAARIEALETGEAALLSLALDQLLAQIAEGERRSHAWPAFVASLSGDRKTLLRVLRDAERRQEKWGLSGAVDRIAERWPDDPEIASLLAARRLASMAPGGDLPKQLAANGEPLSEEAPRPPRP